MKRFFILLFFFFAISANAQIQQLLEEDILVSNFSIDLIEEDKYSSSNIVFSNDLELYLSIVNLNSDQTEEDYFSWRKHVPNTGYAITQFYNKDLQDLKSKSNRLDTKFYKIKIDVFILFGNQFLVIKYNDNIYFFILKKYFYDSSKFVFIFKKS